MTWLKNMTYFNANAYELPLLAPCKPSSQAPNQGFLVPFLLHDMIEEGGKAALAAQVSELEWRQRVLVTGETDEEATFEFTMLQRLGGHSDGVFYTRSLKAEPPWDPKSSSLYSL
jgi:hypothetical protein